MKNIRNKNDKGRKNKKIFRPSEERMGIQNSLPNQIRYNSNKLVRQLVYHYEKKWLSKD